MKKVLIAVFWLVMFFLMGVAPTLQAADFEKELSKAFINVPPDASNASMGNTWVATPFFGSNSAAVTAMGTYERGVVSLNYGVIDFEKGPDVQFYAPSALAKLPFGVLQFSYAARNSDQFFAGVEQGIYKDSLYLYCGWAGDGPTTGIGMYFENGGLNVAYMHDTNDGLNKTLGKTKVVMVSAYLNF